jgi:hypothetical protein
MAIKKKEYIHPTCFFENEECEGGLIERYHIIPLGGFFLPSVYTCSNHNKYTIRYEDALKRYQNKDNQ